MRVKDLPIVEELKEFVEKYRKVTYLYPPQIEAVRAGILNGKNIVMCTATATGKTFIAELAMVNRVLTERVKAIMTVPLRALAYEKFKDLKIYEKLGLRVTISTGEYSSEDKWIEHYDIVITTYEKLDSLLRHKASWLQKVGVLVIDELHYIGDPKRGPIVESIIAKLRLLNMNSQIIGLSATIGNADEIANWLEATLVKSDWRPVELREGVFYDNVIYFKNGSTKPIKDFGNPLVNLTLDTLLENGQVLIFTNSRANTVKIANLIAKHIAQLNVKVIDPKELSNLASKIVNIEIMLNSINLFMSS